MEIYRRRNRTDSAVNPQSMSAGMQETELVLKLKKEELKASLALNENLNSESRKLLQQIESWNSLQT